MIREHNKAPAITRAAAILRLLGKSDTPLGVNAIARELALVPSTCLYVLRALTAEELVAFDPATKRYALDAGVLALARGWLKRDRFADLVQPPLARIAADFGVTALGVQVAGLEHMTVIATALGGGGFRLSAEVGSRFPALISATGRCVAAFGGHGESALRKRFDALRWDLVPDWEQWWAEVAQTRARGWAIDAGRYIEGVTVIAAPVWRSSGAPSNALVAVGLSGAVERSGVEALGEALRAAAKGLTDQLSGG